jgi:PAS domain S-box-containing protein
MNRIPSKLAKLSASIREDQDEAEALFLSIGEGAIVTDSHGRLSRINQVALKILGFKFSELKGKWYPDAVIAEDESGQVIPNIARPITQVFLTGRTISARLYYRRKDGSSVPVSLTVSPVLRSGRPIGAIEVFRDITKELALERAKDDFISVASHQLRTPATAVKQYVGMFLEGYAGKLTPTQKRLLKRAYDSNERQLMIIEDLLRVARVDSGNLRLNLDVADIVQLLDDVISDQAAEAARRQQSIDLETEAKEIAVNIDADRMRMVFENIIDNAIKYSLPGKNIQVRVSQTKDHAHVSIIDEGVGIAAADLEKLFEKFSRVPNDLSVEAGGTGLGLYWAERIIKLHKGRIAVESVLGRGSTFSIRLPLAGKHITEKS